MNEHAQDNLKRVNHNGLAVIGKVIIVCVMCVCVCMCVCVMCVCVCVCVALTLTYTIIFTTRFYWVD